MSFEYATSKLGNVQPATRSIAKELYEAAEANGHEIWFMWGMGQSTEHTTGRALDLMVRNKSAGDFLRDYVWKHRARLRLIHVIWWQRITSTVNRPGVVRKMSDRGNSTANHMDHPHVLFLPGEYVPLPKPVTAASSAYGTVERIQRSVDVTVDGKWGPKTDSRVMRMRMAARNKSGWPSNTEGQFDIEDVQSIINTKVDGVWGPNSQSALVNWIEYFQATIHVKVDGKWGPKTDGKLLLARRRYFNKY